MSPDQLVSFALISTALAVAVVAVMLWIARRESTLSPPPPKPSAGPETLQANEDPDELIAVLAAAATAALGSATRIRHVHLQRESRGENWSRAGRMDVMVSHRVVPKR